MKQSRRLESDDKRGPRFVCSIQDTSCSSKVMSPMKIERNPCRRSRAAISGPTAASTVHSSSGAHRPMERAVSLDRSGSARSRSRRALNDSSPSYVVRTR